MTTKLSVFILAYNSEDKIEDALKSVQWVDEVVVIDSHSVDRTAEIAAKYGAKLVFGYRTQCIWCNRSYREF